MDLASLTSGIKGKVALGCGAALLVLVLCLASAWGGYRHGYGTAKAAGDAKYNALAASQAQANRLASDQARRIVDAEVVRRDELERKLTTARAAIAGQGRAITNRRIEDASRTVVAADGGCSFGVDWVRLWNEASGFGNGAATGSAAAPGADGTAGAVQAAGAGVSAKVTPGDVLANHRDNMTLCRDIAARYRALIEWAEGLPKTVNATEGR